MASDVPERARARRALTRLATQARAAARRAARWVREHWFRTRDAKAATGDAALRSGAISPSDIEQPELDTETWSADAGLAALSRTLSHPDPSVRASALALVTEFSEGRAGVLIAALMRDPHASVRLAAVNAAARVGATSSVASLIVALEDPNLEVRRAAARAIEQLTGEVVELSEPDGSVSEQQLDALKAAWKRRRLTELTDE